MANDMGFPASVSGASRATRRAPLALGLGLAAFVLLLGYLVASSLTRRSAPTFAPSPVGVPLATGGALTTVTLDARAQDEWRYLDLDRAVALSPGDSSGWDLAVQRFRIRTARPVTGSLDLGRWYTYGALSHLLEPTGRVYQVLTDAGRSARVEIVSYYCPGLEAGCLTTRYRIR